MIFLCIYIYIYIYTIYIYIYICMFVSICVIFFSSYYVWKHVRYPALINRQIYIYIYIYICFQFDAFVREHVRHRALLMGYSMWLELTRVCCLNCFYKQFFYECWSFLFLRVCFSLPTLPIIYFWYLIRCVCVLEWFGISLIVNFSLCLW